MILVIQFVWSFLDQREVDLKNKIYFDLDGGSAEVLPWGQTEWTKAYDNQLVLEGDMLLVEKESRGTLGFYNKTHVRMDEETKLNVEAIDTDDDLDQVKLVLRSGTAWLNVDSIGGEPMQVVVLTDNLRITSNGTIFEVGVTDRETVRVLEGEVLVEILEPDSDREVVLEQMKVGVGQEIEVTSSDMATMVARQPVSLLVALSDEWKSTNWYQWNIDEDEHLLAGETDDEETNVALDHSSAETIATVTLEVELPDEDLETDEETVTADDGEEVTTDDQDLTVPMITVSIPALSPRTLSDEDEMPYSIQGTASLNTASIVVTSYSAGGAASYYVLQHFEAGDAIWRYGASNTYGNLREGRNLFTVVATSEAGVKSEPVEVIIIVPDGFFDADEEVETTTEEESTTSVEEEASEETATTATLPLVAPSVTSLNGDPLNGTYETSADSVLVLGTVSTSTVAVYVNDFKLTKFVSGSGEWSYYAQNIHGNYAPGTNTYTVYAEDAGGNMSAGFVFEIYRVAP